MIRENAIIEEKQVIINNVVVNGVPQHQNAKVVVVSCPKCGTIIQQFNLGISLIDVLKSISTYEEKSVFCPKCGQKLRLERGEIIENEQQTVESGQ